LPRSAGHRFSFLLRAPQPNRVYSAPLLHQLVGSSPRRAFLLSQSGGVLGIVAHLTGAFLVRLPHGFGSDSLHSVPAGRKCLSGMQSRRSPNGFALRQVSFGRFGESTKPPYDPKVPEIDSIYRVAGPLKGRPGSTCKRADPRFPRPPTLRGMGVRTRTTRKARLLSPSSSWSGGPPLPGRSKEFE